ncbi:MAG: helix-turn-helix domain-containing protein [Oscillospiraceae bacterium]|nr:helix-turn-helix domain-containing protein [Oscillospiraceae bacterium]
MAKAVKRLDLEGRKKLEQLYLAEERVGDIAKQLDVSIATIYRELKRGYTNTQDKNGRPAYSAFVAERVTAVNKVRRRGPYVVGER